MKSLKKLKKIDIFAQPVQLFIKKESGHKTFIGALFSLVVFSFFGYLLTINLYTLSNRDNPVSYTTEVYHSDPNRYILAPENFTLTFAFESRETRTYIDESIYVVEATLNKKKLKMQISSNRVDGKQIIDWETVYVPLAPCSKNILRQRSLENFFARIDQPSNYCIDWNNIKNLELQGTFDSSEYSYLLLQFKSCNEKSKKSRECKTKDEIKSKLEQNYFSFQLSSYSIDVKSENQPFLPKGEDLFTTISSKIFKEISIYLQPISIFSDFGKIFQDQQEELSLRYKRSTEMIDLNDSDLIMNVVIRLDQIEQQYYRSYPKLSVILSQLGGLWQIVFTLALLIQKPIKIISYYMRIVNSLFQFEQKNSNIDPILQSDQNILSSTGQLFEHKQNKSQKNIAIYVNEQLKASQQLEEIKQKKAKLEELEQSCQEPNLKENIKAKLSKKMSKSIKDYFQTISKKLKLSWVEMILLFNCCFSSNNYKVKQARYAFEKTNRHLDIIYILKKLQEIDKLKMITLSSAQLKVFDYLQKPMIPLNPNSNQQWIEENKYEFYPVLTQMKYNYKRAFEAQKAFNVLVENINDPISNRLVNYIDCSIADLLQLQKLTNDQIFQDQVEEDDNMRNKVFILNTPKNKIKSFQEQQMKLGSCQSNQSPRSIIIDPPQIISDDET